jgi:hypothetical protein
MDDNVRRESPQADDAMQPDEQPAAEHAESGAPAAPAETADAEMSQEAIDLPVNTPVPMETEDDFHVHAKPRVSHQVFEMSVDVHPEDITENPLCLWSVLEDCFAVSVPKAKLRRVEVSFRKLSESDKLLFEKAMQKEWNSWIESKVVSICRSKGIPTERIIRARWVLTWKASSDPDIKDRTPKARLVIVGWQDPDLGKVATDSPTLRKVTKHLILSLCAARRWKLWGADIKTAFLSGDPSLREIYVRPPAEIKKWRNLSDQELFRLEKAAYGLAEAPKAWYLRLSREVGEVGLTVSQLDPCLFVLRKGGKTIGVCGIHVDDLIGGGTKEMDDVLDSLRKRLPFGDYRTFTIRYTGVETRQDPQSMEIEVGQETYIDALQPVSTKALGNASTPLTDPKILRTCAGQLAWVASSTRADQSFLASYLQGAQDKGTVAHIHLYNKAIREMKERKVCLRFPSSIKDDEWRIMCVADAGWGTRENGESQGGYVLCSPPKKCSSVREPKPG